MVGVLEVKNSAFLSFFEFGTYWEKGKKSAGDQSKYQFQCGGFIGLEDVTSLCGLLQVVLSSLAAYWDFGLLFEECSCV